MWSWRALRDPRRPNLNIWKAQQEHYCWTVNIQNTNLKKIPKLCVPEITFRNLIRSCYDWSPLVGVDWPLGTMKWPLETMYRLTLGNLTLKGEVLTGRQDSSQMFCSFSTNWLLSSIFGLKGLVHVLGLKMSATDGQSDWIGVGLVVSIQPSIVVELIQARRNFRLSSSWLKLRLLSSRFKLEALKRVHFPLPSGSNSLFGNDPHKRNFKRTAQAWLTGNISQD